MKEYTRICANCGDTFITMHPRQKYCRKVKIRTCPICGDKFEQVCEGQISSICGKPECLKAVKTFYKPHNPKKCKICGEEFIPKSYRSSYCGRTHKRICSICGKEFDYKCEKDSDPNICYECRGKKFKRVCKICGKEFISDTPSKSICACPHYRTCEICGKQFEVPGERWYDKNLTCCSVECTNIKRGRSISKSIHMLPKGYNAPKTLHHKICKWCGEPFDTYISQKIYCDRIHYKKCEVCGTLFEVPNEYLSSSTLRNYCSNECRIILMQRTCLKKYGVDNYSKTKEYKENLRSKREEIDEKRKKTMIERYGVESISQTDSWMIKHMSDESKLDNLKEFMSDPRSFIKSNFVVKPTVHMIAMSIGVNDSSALDRIHKLGVEDCIEIHYSDMENDVTNYLLSIDSDLEITHNDRIQIKPNEIDLYLNEYKLGIECDPTSTHNSSRNNWNNNISGIPPSYHKMKTDMCEDKGIFLFHIFGYEWTHKREIIESMIKNILGKCDQKIYARKCVVKEVDSNTATKFLNANHRQGAAGASVRLGLYYQGDLVSLMTFGKMRNTIGTSKNEDLSDCWELVRFCSNLNTSVVGGASKLFKHFIRTYDPVRIRSFSDRAHTRGTLYQKLRFTELRRSDPGYVWVDLYTDRAYNRYNTQKQNIKKFLHDDTIDLSKSEKQIMEEHDFVQVFDCGTVTWEYHIPEPYRTERSE